jgi:hypothetical protein
LNDTLAKIYADDRIPMDKKIEIITNLTESINNISKAIVTQTPEPKTDIKK